MYHARSSSTFFYFRVALGFKMLFSYCFFFFSSLSLSLFLLFFAFFFFLFNNLLYFCIGKFAIMGQCLSMSFSLFYLCLSPRVVRLLLKEGFFCSANIDLLSLSFVAACTIREERLREYRENEYIYTKIHSNSTNRP